MDDSPEDDGPGSSLVESDVLIERNDVVQGCPTQHGDEVPAYGKKDEGDIHVKNEGGSPGDDWQSEKEQFSELVYRGSDEKTYCTRIQTLPSRWPYCRPTGS